MQSKEQLQAELIELEAKAANIKKQIESLDNKPTPEQRFIELMFQTNSLKIDKNKYACKLFGFKDSDYLWEYNSKKKLLRLIYPTIWKILETEYSLNYQQMLSLTKSVIEEHFKLKGLTICRTTKLNYLLVEEHFKNKQ